MTSSTSSSRLGRWVRPLLFLAGLVLAVHLSAAVADTFAPLESTQFGGLDRSRVA